MKAGLRGDGMAEIAVADTGPGIAAENLSKIFDPFFSTKAKGTGLGLALVQQIAVEHGGRVDVESGVGATASGSAATGTTFRFLLPAWGPPRRTGRATMTHREGSAAARGAPTVALRGAAWEVPGTSLSPWTGRPGCRHSWPALAIPLRVVVARYRGVGAAGCARGSPSLR